MLCGPDDGRVATSTASPVPAAGRPPSSPEAAPRRTQAERTEATRAKLLDATLECLAELGYAGTTTTEVSRRAGVSRGAQLHHFPTRADLVAAAARQVLAARVREVTVALGALPAGRERIQSVIDLLWGIFQSPTLVAWHELVMAGRTDPELGREVAAITDELHHEISALWADLFPDGLGGLDPSINAAVPWMLFAVLDGLSVLQMTGAQSAGPRADQVIALTKALGAYFDTITIVDESTRKEGTS